MCLYTHIHTHNAHTHTHTHTIAPAKNLFKKTHYGIPFYRFPIRSRVCKLGKHIIVPQSRQQRPISKYTESQNTIVHASEVTHVVKWVNCMCCVCVCHCVCVCVCVCNPVLSVCYMCYVCYVCTYLVLSTSNKKRAFFIASSFINFNNNNTTNNNNNNKTK